ncbi:unnamed protein product, partial [Ectocarpus sp. 13 AM-2016]
MRSSIFTRRRYTPHRRGRWWNRLSLDLAHAKRLPCALWASQEGLRDPQVRGGDRLALEKRASMLSTRCRSCCRLFTFGPRGL